MTNEKTKAAPDAKIEAARKSAYLGDRHAEFKPPPSPVQGGRPIRNGRTDFNGAYIAVGNDFPRVQWPSRYCLYLDELNETDLHRLIFLLRAARNARDFPHGRPDGGEPVGCVEGGAR
jgi:hypothetical protein